MQEILNKIQWGDIATWATGFATFGAFCVAVYSILKQQTVINHNKKFSQAEKVSVWVVKNRYSSQRGTTIKISNKSDSPVYGVVISLVAFQGAAPHTGKEISSLSAIDQKDYRLTISVLPPNDDELVFVFKGFYSGMHLHPGVEIAFTDRAGVNWVRNSRGNLEEIDATSVEEYYKLSPPIDWDLTLG